MYAVIATVFTALSVPALWLGLKLVVLFDLPFVAFSAPVFICLGIACWAVSRFDEVSSS